MNPIYVVAVWDRVLNKYFAFIVMKSTWITISLCIGSHSKHFWVRLSKYIRKTPHVYRNDIASINVWVESRVFILYAGIPWSLDGNCVWAMRASDQHHILSLNILICMHMDVEEFLTSLQWCLFLCFIYDYKKILDITKPIQACKQAFVKSIEFYGLVYAERHHFHSEKW